MKKAVLMAAVLGLALSTGAAACPQDRFQEQSGHFSFLIQGNFNGRQFSHRVESPRQLFRLLRKIRQEIREYRRNHRGGSPT